MDNRHPELFLGYSQLEPSVFWIIDIQNCFWGTYLSLSIQRVLQILNHPALSLSLSLSTGSHYFHFINLLYNFHSRPRHIHGMDPADINIHSSHSRYTHGYTFLPLSLTTPLYPLSLSPFLPLFLSLPLSLSLSNPPRDTSGRPEYLDLEVCRITFPSCQ